MSVRIEAGIIHLEGLCPVEDAEPLLAALQDDPDRAIDLSALTRAHLAVAQILAAARPTLIGAPEQGFVGELLLPALGREKDTVEPPGDL